MTENGSGRTLRSAIFHALRAGFRALPISEATRDAMRQRFLERFPTIRPITPQGQAVPTMERRARVHAGGRAIGYVERTDEPLPDPLPATLVAFYLPQFHTIPENDEWWGKGFTEWRNVARALPQFEGHAQPRLPGDLGFYDLRNPQVLRDQAELAQAYGIGAFCMYFYWFGGKTLLELPHQQWLNDPSITLPICLCWANENWTRTWDGRAEDVLIAQQHSLEDDLAYIAHVAQYLRDPRYLRVDGKPLLLVYRPGKLPDPKATADRWRSWCRDNGIGELCIGYVQSFERPDPRDIGFDVAVEFPPNLSTPTNITERQTLLNPDYQGEVLDWRDVAREYSERPMPEYRLFPGVNCGWDNEPRKPGRGRTFIHASTHGFSEWVRATIDNRLSRTPDADRHVFVNAWNEWAEGAVLEPDGRHGLAWLHACRRGLGARPQSSLSLTERPVARRPCVVLHAWYPDILEEILSALTESAMSFRLVVTTPPATARDVDAALARHHLTAEVVTMPNRGRDVLPFLRVASRLRDEGEEIVLKLHTKQSPHRADGGAWRRDMIRALTCRSRVVAIQRAFHSNPRLGIVAPEGHLQPLSYYWGANAAATRHVARLMGIAPPDSGNDEFVSGSMFWVRLSALAPLLDADLDDLAFEAEAGQVDGTLAHAVERLFALSARQLGLTVITAAHACGAPEVPLRRSYPYARRD
ncbi:glycoside hydrolase family 99-like domain-containing protein [Cognatilysobacter tabacisoli]|uniref:glycoside hydrolase family 99-like domain-containing protein n=1 Tax=Cognatilysobacter tabacisoli TaxID=2315424 RepID=UPI000E6B1BF2|nr:glycoside hydrolase family 99-like domain-containing protein [Lysobacter tabacisoli]